MDSPQDAAPKETSSETPLSPEDQVIMQKLQLFMLQNAERVTQWYKAHAPNKPMPPVYFNTDLQEFVWKSRKMRRLK